MIACVVLLVIGLTALMLVNTQPRYTATAELTLVDPGQQSTPIADILSGVPLSRQLVEQEISTMRSKAFMIDVVKRLELNTDPTIFEMRAPPSLPTKIIRRVKRTISGMLRPAQPPAPAETPGELETSATTETARIASEATTDGTLDDAQNEAFLLLAEELEQYGDAADNLAGMLRIAQRGNGYVIAVSAESTDPDVAARIANATAREYTRFSLDLRGESIEGQVKLLSARVDELGRDLENAENEVVDFEANVAQADSGSAENLEKQIQDLSRRLIEARADVVRAQAEHRRVLTIIDQNGLVAAAEVLESPILNQLRGQRSELRIERSRAVEQFGPESDRALAIDAVINRIEEELGVETVRISSVYGTEVEIAQEISSAIAGELATLEARMVERSKSMVELSKLRRIADANRIAYEQFLRAATESAQIRALQQATIRLLSYAEVPEQPSSPRTLFSMAIAGFAGLSIALGLALMIEAFNNNVLTMRQLRNVSGLPVIGSISKVRPFGRIRSLLTYVMPRSWGPQHQLATLREEGNKVSLFLTSAIDRRNSTIVVTSAVEGEGKSVLAALIAEGFAKRSDSVLLVDAGGGWKRSDMQFAPYSAILPRHRAHHSTELTDRGYSIFRLQPFDAGKDYPAMPNQERIELLQEASEEFDYVIIDASPVLASADALKFVRDADAVVLASRWNATASQAIEACVQQLRDLRVQNIFAVMTMVNRSVERKYEYRGFENTLRHRAERA